MNGVIVFDKPRGWTSHDAVDFFRRLLGMRWIGHLGTLDPRATGVLPVLVGAAARLAEYAPLDKAYEAEGVLGIATDTGDLDGRPLREGPVPSFLLEEDVRRAVAALEFLVEQVPPMVSAKKQGGRRLYELARKGVEVTRAPRPVRVRRAELTKWDPPRLAFRVECSAGTYVRGLFETVAASLGSVGALDALRRTRSGPFALEEAVTEAQAAAWRGGGAPPFLWPMDRLVSHLPEVRLPPPSVERLRRGVEVWAPGPGPEGTVRLATEEGELFGMGEAVRSGAGFRIRPKKILSSRSPH